MNFNEYQQNCLRTCNTLDNSVLNCIHMVLGITSEYFETLEQAHITNNFTGLIEDHIKETEKLENELGDVLWYLALLCYFGEYEFSRGENGFIKYNPNKAIEVLNSAYKANWIYNRDMNTPDKTGIPPKEQCQSAICSLIMWIEVEFPFKINNIMEKNIAKLSARYPEKFDNALANNRVEDSTL